MARGNDSSPSRRGRGATAAALVLLCALAAAAQPETPTGRLPRAIAPTAYRLELTVDPAEPRFAGHVEIDARLAEPARTIFLHGSGLAVSRALITAGSTTHVARYSEVDPTGVARLDLDAELAPGAVTLALDYTAEFRDGAEGLFRAEVAGEWYAWTQLQPIDGRRMFPGFDEPGFKTPFAVTVTAPSGLKVFANAPELEARASGAQTVHRFAPTRPLPTYLVALGVGAFDVLEATIPPNAVRAQPLALRVIATRGQNARMRWAAAEAPRLLERLERYLGTAYPFEKLDLIASPTHGGAMENAGLIVFDDTLLLLDDDASQLQLRDVAETVAHEMAHQWFGDLVTPAWWTDLWLNESFAQWLGKKIADEWRPDLGVGATLLDEALAAMDVDSLGEGRPIRQEITESSQVASAFDAITYAKGAQVLAMFENFLGPDQFQAGVRLHLGRFRYGNATAEDFFASLAQAADNPSVVPSLRTFTDQVGVPLVSVQSSGASVTLSQSRYQPLGVSPGQAQRWTIPLCLARGDVPACALLAEPSATLRAPAGSAPLMPNSDGAGYYRFRLDDAGWERLIEGAAALPAREALAVVDSVWADFAAGTGSFARVVDYARELSAHAERAPAVRLAAHLKYVGDSMLAPEQVPAYRKLMRSVYGPRLAALGPKLRADEQAGVPLGAQALRDALVPVIALDGRDPELRAQLSAAAEQWLDGDRLALARALLEPALSVVVQDGGAPAMRELVAELVASNDPDFRRQALNAIGSADTPEQASVALELAFAPGLQTIETVMLLRALALQPGARATVARFADERFDEIMQRMPAFMRPNFPVRLFPGYCGAGDAEKVDAFIRPKLPVLGGDDLGLERVKEQISMCAALKAAKVDEIAALLAEYE